MLESLWPTPFLNKPFAKFFIVSFKPPAFRYNHYNSPNLLVNITVYPGKQSSKTNPLDFSLYQPAFLHNFSWTPLVKIYLSLCTKLVLQRIFFGFGAVVQYDNAL